MTQETELNVKAFMLLSTVELTKRSISNLVWKLVYFKATLQLTITDFIIYFRNALSMWKMNQ